MSVTDVGWAPVRGALRQQTMLLRSHLVLLLLLYKRILILANFSEFVINAKLSTR